MKKIKFKIEYVPLSDERIERHKDFNKLMAAYALHPRPDWKSRLTGNKGFIYLGGLLSGAALMTLGWWGTHMLSEHHHLATTTPQESHMQAQTPNDQQVTELIHRVDSLTQMVSQLQKEQAGQALEMENEEANAGAAVNLNHDSKSQITSGVTRVAIAHATNPSSVAASEINSEEARAGQKTVTEQAAVMQKQPQNQLSLDDSTRTSSSENSDSNEMSSADSATAHELQNTLEDSLQEVSRVRSVLPGDTIAFNSGAAVAVDSLSAKDRAIMPSSAATESKQIAVTHDRTDSAKKGIHLSFPKIDWGSGLKKSKDAVNGTIDSLSVRSGKLFGNLFQKDTLKLQARQQKQPLILPADSFKHRFAQVTLISPIGTDGLNAKDYEHNLSLNVFQGYNGALNGVEFGGIANVERGYANGVQFGGIANVVLGNVQGVQFGGIVNHNQSLRGVAFSGLVSSTMGSVHGAQFSGITSFALDTFNGLQTSGILSLALSEGEETAMQLAGAANLSIGILKGVQLSGGINVANRMNGIQISTINVAKKIKGFQLGVINIADTIDGEALGLLSVSANGQHHLDVFGSEILYGSVGVRLGSPHIYNIFAAGVAPINSNDVRLGFGMGLGGHFDLHPVFIDLDGISWTIHNNSLNDWNYVNLWNQIRLTCGYEFAKGIAAYIGPTANVQVFNQSYTPIAPYTIYNHQGATNVQGWVGFVAGLRFF